MGFNQKPLHLKLQQHQQELIGNAVKPSREVVDNAIPTEFLQLRESDANLVSQTYEGATMRDLDEDISPGIHRQKNKRGRATAVDETECLPDVNDIEVTRYLLKEEEKHFKRIIWEALNRDHTKVKKPKKGIQKKKDISAKATKTTKKRSSSKINYEALEKLDDELNGNPGHDVDVQPRDSGFALHESPVGNYDGLEQSLEAYDDYDTYEEQDSDVYCRGMDAFDNDEY